MVNLLSKVKCLPTPWPRSEPTLRLGSHLLSLLSALTSVAALEPSWGHLGLTLSLLLNDLCLGLGHPVPAVLVSLESIVVELDAVHSVIVWLSLGSHLIVDSAPWWWSLTSAEPSTLSPHASAACKL